MPPPLRLVVVGAGNRGTTYSQYALEHPDRLVIAAVCERVPARRERFRAQFGLAADACFEDWADIVAREPLGDAVLIATQDREHAEPVCALAPLGYHILLEKPMATTPEECARIVHAVRKAKVQLCVCHVLRYSPYNTAVRHLLEEGRIGQVVAVQHLEPVGAHHAAHSYVRGNWRNADTSSGKLLAKSCHDVDLLCSYLGKPQRVSSFGSLRHFTRDNRPAGAADRCLDCRVEPSCVYSAKRAYIDRGVAAGELGWPVSVLVDEVPDIENITDALRTGPYGLCVYGGTDNNVVDNQVVSLQFAGGETASLSMVDFTQEVCTRKTRIFGSAGEVLIDGETIEVRDFGTGAVERITPPAAPPGGSAMSTHDYADYYLMQAFVDAIREKRPELILSGPDVTLVSHMATFAAEAARESQTVVDVDAFAARFVD